jgi:hypothetical protein
MFAQNDLVAPAPPPGAATDAVMMPPALVPNVTLFAFEKFRVLNVNEPAESEAASPTSAVMTVEFAPAPNPKLILFEFEKLTVLVEIVAPLAAIPRIASPPPAPADTVIELPFPDKVMLLPPCRNIEALLVA